MTTEMFELRVALFSAIGYCVAIAGPLYLDPRLSSHVRHGARIHRHSLLWLFLAPIAFVAPYWGLGHAASTTALILWSLGPLLLLATIAAWSFPPERPHSAVLFCTLGFVLMIAVTVLFHHTRMGDFGFVSNAAIPMEARLERVKATVTLWQMILVYGAAGYMAFVVTWVYAMWFTTDKRVASAQDMFTLGQAQVAFALVLSICVVFGPLLEAFVNLAAATAQLTNVK